MCERAAAQSVAGRAAASINEWTRGDLCKRFTHTTGSKRFVAGALWLINDMSDAKLAEYVRQLVERSKRTDAALEDDIVQRLRRDHAEFARKPHTALRKDVSRVVRRIRQELQGRHDRPGNDGDSAVHSAKRVKLSPAHAHALGRCWRAGPSPRAWPQPTW